MASGNDISNAAAAAPVFSAAASIAASPASVTTSGNSTFSPNMTATLTDVFGDFEQYLKDQWTHGETSGPAKSADLTKLENDLAGLGETEGLALVAQGGGVNGLLAKALIAIKSHLGI